MCHRQRYVDMIVTEETRNTFRARSRIVSTIRRHLEDKGFLEVRALHAFAHDSMHVCMAACMCSCLLCSWLHAYRYAYDCMHTKGMPLCIDG